LACLPAPSRSSASVLGSSGRLDAFFLICGIVVTFAVGAGLMALVFYSSRKNFDR